MNDIKLVYDSTLMEFDIMFENSDLMRDDGLETAAIISLYTDGRASTEDQIDNKEDLRGWWGDLIDQNNFLIGSKLWVLNRAKTTTENMSLTKQYILSSLEWMKKDGVCAKISVDVERQEETDGDILAFLVKIIKNDGSIVSIRYSDLWENQLSF